MCELKKNYVHVDSNNCYALSTVNRLPDCFKFEFSIDLTRLENCVDHTFYSTLYLHYDFLIQYLKFNNAL